MPLRALFCALLVCLTGLAPAPAADAPNDAATTAAKFLPLRARPDGLAAFLAAMPKGGDLHNHADGAVYAEDFLSWATGDNACYNPKTYALIDPCAKGDRTLADGIAHDPNLAATVVRALSMQDFTPVSESGHDHFFNSFDKFEPVAGVHPDRVLAAPIADAARANVQYLELMTLLDGGPLFAAAGAVEKTHTFDPGNFAADDAALDGAFAQLVPAAVALAKYRAGEVRADLRCGTPDQSPGCGVTVRYIQSVLRAFPPDMVFAQTRLAFALANDPSTGFVAINYVQPEDNPVAVRDYALHMRIVAYFHKKYPNVPITLHAGEITPALVNRAALTDHIRQAVEVAGARRIGHGVDVMGERDAPGLLREMAAKQILVEIALTSNDLILNVRGAAHPLPAYLAAGVPIALVTDDAGVSRSDLTHEFVRAVQTYGYTYPELKNFVRNSIHYAFIPGASLWADPTYLRETSTCANERAPACTHFLNANAKAAAEMKLERALRTFEHVQATTATAG